MYLPLNNGLRFFRVNASLVSIEIDFERETYGLQKTYSHTKEQYSQLVDGTDISTIQVISPVNATITVQIFNPANTQIATNSMAFVGLALGRADSRVYNFTINWAAVTGFRECSYIVITQGANRFRSEPIRYGERESLLKLVYSNEFDHLQIGSYLNCFEMVAYIPGRLVEPEQPRELDSHMDSKLADVYLAEAHFRERTLQVFAAPQYLHLITQYAIRHERLTVIQKVAAKTYFSDWQWLQNYQSQHVPFGDLYPATATLKKVADRIRAITAGGENLLVPLVAITSVTSVNDTSFTANWSANGADSFDVQLSTDEAFGTTLISVSTVLTQFTFSPLTPCTIYYYRVRAVSCAGVSAWTTGETRETVSMHFRGEQNVCVAELLLPSFKLRDLQFVNFWGNLETVRFKYAPIHGVLIWGSYSYRTFAQIEADILNTGAGAFSIYVEAESYAQGQEGLAVLSYVVPRVRISAGCLTYQFRVISQDVFIGFINKTTFSNATVAAVGAGTLSYQLISNLGGMVSAVDYNVSSLASLNTAINLLPIGTIYAVGVYFSYNPASSEVSAVASFNLTYS